MLQPVKRMPIPDIANVKINAGPTLSKVGMENIEIPVQLSVGSGTQSLTLPARANAFVSLDCRTSRGIHMSRLYLILQEEVEHHAITKISLLRILEKFLKSHEQLSDDAYLDLKLEVPLKRDALISDYSGWRSYPLALSASLNRKGEFNLAVKLVITYSSTCPCSAALARQVIQTNFSERFSEQESVKLEDAVAWLGTEDGIGATPHGQRSEATIVVESKSGEIPDLRGLIDLVENAVATPVQSAVKRQDEQEFAVRNATNLMFAEDAARRIKTALSTRPDFKRFSIDCVHFESLHPHNAVAKAHSDEHHT